MNSSLFSDMCRICFLFSFLTLFSTPVATARVPIHASDTLLMDAFACMRIGQFSRHAAKVEYLQRYICIVLYLLILAHCVASMNMNVSPSNDSLRHHLLSRVSEFGLWTNHTRTSIDQKADTPDVVSTPSLLSSHLFIPGKHL